MARAASSAIPVAVPTFIRSGHWQGHSAATMVPVMDTLLRRRILVGALWFLAGWVWVGAAVALLALPGLITPLGAVATAALAVRLYRRQTAAIPALAGTVGAAPPLD